MMYITYLINIFEKKYKKPLLQLQKSHMLAKVAFI